MWTFKLKSLLMKRIYYTLSQFSLFFLAVDFNGIYKTRGRICTLRMPTPRPAQPAASSLTPSLVKNINKIADIGILNIFLGTLWKMYETGSHGYQQNLLLLVCPSKVLASRPPAKIIRIKTKLRLFLKFYYFFRCRKDGFGHKILSLSTLYLLLGRYVIIMGHLRF